MLQRLQGMFSVKRSHEDPNGGDRQTQGKSQLLGISRRFGTEQAPSLEPTFPHIGNPDLEFLRNERTNSAWWSTHLHFFISRYIVTSDLSPKFGSVP